MLTEKEMTYEDLEVEAYVTELEDYWKNNSKVFRMDSVGFLYLWGGIAGMGRNHSGVLSACAACISAFAIPGSDSVE